MRIIFFDTETTGNTDNDRLCQLGVKDRGVAAPVINALYKPPLPITFEAMAVHHITEKMVADKPSFQASSDYAAMKELFESPDTVCVAHNIAFDAAVLAREGIVPRNMLCTLKVARALDETGVFTNYKLQYLRYRLGIEIEDATAHDAWGDVLVLEQLFERLFAKYLTKANGDEAAALAAMQEITRLPSLLKTITFGKHNGKKITDVAKEDASYLRWLLDQKRAAPQGEEDWIYTLEQALNV
ncbi:hypothetical protein A3C87_02405 [Candidatus Kaiserbacteria bacterium RIFCSPHIGHO2_02_FULL_49_34]|uniref:Exonuclease domain-containing protein n=1 Tax=Candidatus Kaiserbacteria bacterium RIFCSPHIGHO2_02_FULL_49_34 TaxID=1798491 RepID=A0A1F6DM05_9BACT|nr:MAG: hypothetical protein A3C87_02405 [Candidatus Kaiserbacteria bacterium RIFCSPHIGHO2_02_FULL_49_34]